MKIALLSDGLPPAPTGQGMLIYRLLEGIDPEQYCLISTPLVDPTGQIEGYAQKLPGQYHYLSGGFRLTRGYRFGLSRVREWLNFPIAVLERARRIAKLLKREKCQALVAFTGDVTHLPAGMLACRMVGIPFFAYMVDHYSYREWHNPAAAFWAKRLEPLLMKKADGLLVLNEALRDDLRDRFGVQPEVIYNSFDLSAYDQAVNNSVGREGVKIVFTGDIYDAHYDAFRNLLKAIALLHRTDVNLHVYTWRPPAELADKGISGPVIFHGQLAADEIPGVQMAADILFLPLAFDSPYPGVVRTSAPTKMGEYLAARRPVIVHAPPDSFVVHYFRKHECGVVVDQLDPSLLADQIARVLVDSDLRDRLAARAWDRARSDFDIVRAKAKFWNFGERGGSAGVSRIERVRDRTTPHDGPLVSVIVPTFNYGAHIGQTLERLGSQSFPNWECFVVDDGSTDDSAEVVGVYAARDSRINYIRQTNRRQAAARNAGLAASSGQYVQFLDADDLIEPGKLEHQVAYLEAHHEVDIVYGGVRYFRTSHTDERLHSMDEENLPWMPQVSGDGLEILRALVRANIMVVNSPLVRRSLVERVGPFDASLPPAEDWDYWLRCAIAGARFQFAEIEDTLALVRAHAVSSSRNRIRMYRAMVRIREKLEASLDDAELLTLNRELKGTELAILGIEEASGGSSLRGAWHLARAGQSERRWQWRMKLMLCAVASPFVSRQRLESMLTSSITQTVKRLGQKGDTL